MTDNEQASAAPVGSLLSDRGPSAIFWRIGAVIIDAIQTRPLWALTHVCEKILEFEPAFTNCNSATAVIFVSRLPGIEAAGFHSSPNLPGTCEPHSVLGLTGDACISLQAST